MERYILSRASYGKENRVYPRIDGEHAKNHEAFFDTEGMWDKFYEPAPTFDYLEIS